MKKRKLNIAICAPSKNPYSETFIQAHKNCLKGNVFYYYGRGKNIQLEGKRDLLTSFEREFIKLNNFLFRKGQQSFNKKRLLIGQSL